MAELTVADTNRMIGQAIARQRLRDRILEDQRHKKAIRDQMLMHQIWEDAVRRHFFFWKNLNGIGGHNGGK